MLHKAKVATKKSAGRRAVRRQDTSHDHTEKTLKQWKGALSSLETVLDANEEAWALVFKSYANLQTTAEALYSNNDHNARDCLKTLQMGRASVNPGPPESAGVVLKELSQVKHDIRDIRARITKAETTQSKRFDTAREYVYQRDKEGKNSKQQNGQPTKGQKTFAEYARDLDVVTDDLYNQLEEIDRQRLRVTDRAIVAVLNLQNFYYTSNPVRRAKKHAESISLGARAIPRDAMKSWIELRPPKVSDSRASTTAATQPQDAQSTGNLAPSFTVQYPHPQPAFSASGGSTGYLQPPVQPGLSTSSISSPAAASSTGSVPSPPQPLGQPSPGSSAHLYMPNRHFVPPGTHQAHKGIPKHSSSGPAHVSNAPTTQYAPQPQPVLSPIPPHPQIADQQTFTPFGQQQSVAFPFLPVSPAAQLRPGVTPYQSAGNILTPAEQPTTQPQAPRHDVTHEPQRQRVGAVGEDPNPSTGHPVHSVNPTQNVISSPSASNRTEADHSEPPSKPSVLPTPNDPSLPERPHIQSEISVPDVMQSPQARLSEPQTQRLDSQPYTTKAPSSTPIAAPQSVPSSPSPSQSTESTNAPSRSDSSIPPGPFDQFTTPPGSIPQSPLLSQIVPPGLPNSPSGVAQSVTEQTTTSHDLEQPPQQYQQTEANAASALPYQNPPQSSGIQSQMSHLSLRPPAGTIQGHPVSSVSHSVMNVSNTPPAQYSSTYAQPVHGIAPPPQPNHHSFPGGQTAPVPHSFQQNTQASGQIGNPMHSGGTQTSAGSGYCSVLTGPQIPISYVQQTQYPVQRRATAPVYSGLPAQPTGRNGIPYSTQATLLAQNATQPIRQQFHTPNANSTTFTVVAAASGRPPVPLATPAPLHVYPGQNLAPQLVGAQYFSQPRPPSM